MVVTNLAPPLALWKSYAYFPDGHIYRDPRYDPAGGPDGRPCVWADDTLWTIDTPEQPNSILFFIQYRHWLQELPIDLRGAELRFRLRGDHLALHGARCYFWAVTHVPAATRWHFVGQPVAVPEGGWGDEAVLRLAADPAQWHCSFVSKPALHRPAGLLPTLAACFSYGFSFVGFSEKVTGRVALADFQMLVEVDPAWPFSYKPGREGEEWLTVSRNSARQEPITSTARLAAGRSALTGAGGPGLYLLDDYLAIGGQPPFVYLAMAKASGTTGGRDLRNALLMVRQSAAHFDARGGQVCFFVEHAASGTRWVLNVLGGDCSTNNLRWVTLAPDPQLWRRISGDLPLADILTGNGGTVGYDYFGLMLVGPDSEPRGTWGLIQFSLGPALEPREVAALDETTD
jgi:hypothetical protein